MFVQSLRLENFCGFEKFSCEFSSGLNVLVGPNGSGKSSILEALNLTFYTLSVQRAPYIRAGCKSATIDVNFSLNDKFYNCTRTLSSSGSNSAVVREQGGKLIASGANAVKSFFDSNLNLESRGFSWYLKQAHIIEFLQIFSSTNMDKLCSLLGIGRFKNFSSDFNRVLKEFFGDVNTEYSRLDYIKNDLYNKVSELKAEKEEIKINSSEIATLESEREELIKEISRLEALKEQRALWDSLLKANEDLKFCEDKLKEINDSIAVANSNISSYLKLDSAPSMEALKSALSELENELRELRDNYNKGVKYKQLATNSLRVLDNFRQRPRTCIKKLLDSSQQLSAVEARIAFYRRNEFDALSQLHKDLVSNFGNICPLCKQEISEAKAKELADELNRLQEQKVFLQKAITEYKNQNKARNAIRSELNSLRKLILPYKQYADAVDISRVNMHAEFCTKVKEKINELECLHKERDKFLHRQTSQNTYIETLKNSLQVSKEQLNIPIEDKLADALRRKIATENLLQECREKQNKLQVIESKIKWLSDNISTTESSLRLLIEKKDKWLKAQEACENFIEGVGEYLRYFVSGGGLLNHVNKILSDIGVIFTVHFVEVNNNYIFVAKFPDGVELPIERLSYGQRVILVVVLLFVFYITTCSSGILLADEPTAGLDARHLSGLSLLFGRINSLCSTYNVQCIMATHEADLISTSYNVIALEKEAHT